MDSESKEVSAEPSILRLAAKANPKHSQLILALQRAQDDISNGLEVEAAVDREPQGARFRDGLIDIRRGNVRAAGGTLKSKLLADHIF